MESAVPRQPAHHIIGYLCPTPFSDKCGAPRPKGLYLLTEVRGGLRRRSFRSWLPRIRRSHPSHSSTGALGKHSWVAGKTSSRAKQGAIHFCPVST